VTELAIAIPLPAVARRRGLTPIYPRQRDAQALFERLGGTIVAEDQGTLDAFSAASGTVAAHFAYLATIADWLTGRGIDKNSAARYVAATFAPLAEALSPAPAELMTLAEEHSTKGGINEQFYVALRDAGVFETVQRSLDQLPNRSDTKYHLREI
jgi:pyrroline-5-carboxylate reductase